MSNDLMDNGLMGNIISDPKVYDKVNGKEDNLEENVSEVEECLNGLTVSVFDGIGTAER
jgi:hypothetical protein